MRIFRSGQKGHNWNIIMKGIKEVWVGVSCQGLFTLRILPLMYDLSGFLLIPSWTQMASKDWYIKMVEGLRYVYCFNYVPCYPISPPPCGPSSSSHGHDQGGSGGGDDGCASLLLLSSVQGLRQYYTTKGNSLAYYSPLSFIQMVSLRTWFWH